MLGELREEALRLELGFQQEQLRRHERDEHDEVEARRIRRRVEMVIQQLEATGAPSSMRLPDEGKAQVYAWLKREDRSVAWLARQVERSRGHLQAVLAQERDISPALAERLSEATGIEIDVLTPLGLSRAVAS